MTVRPFRFGIQIKQVPDGRTWLDQVRRCEDLGVAVVTLADHFDTTLSPMPALAAAAAVTSEIRFGTMVLGNDYRHPVVTARDAATIDIVSGGRFELGLGAGWMTVDYEGAGLHLDRPGLRIERLAESCQIVRALLDTGTCHHEGAHYRVQLTDQLRASSRVPLVLGGGGPRMLRLAGEVADVVALNVALTAGVLDESAGADATWERTLAKLDAVRAGAGDRFEDIELQTRVHLAAITDDRDGLAAQLGPAFGLTPEQATRTPHALFGTESQIVDQLVRQREQSGISYIGLGIEALEEFAPVIARLAGT